MEIKIQFRGKIYSLCFGYHTEWFEQIWGFSIVEEYFENREVVHADFINHWF